jgi:hypothetical protein
VTLSVCCITADAGPRVAAILELLRPVADEVVVAADARVEPDALREYAAFADRLHRIEFALTERHLAWLHARCSGDWILRIDGDEVPSRSLVQALPELTSARDVVQYMLPRRWLYPDAERWLEELPWWPDYQVRLVRNDGLLRFRGTPHSGATATRPARYLESHALYHLALLEGPRTDRASGALRYEELELDLRAPGGGPLTERFYRPDLHAGRTQARVPAEDREPIAAVIEASPRAGAPDVEPPRVVSLQESDRWWAGRPVAESSYAAELTPFEADYRMARGERGVLHFRVVNRGTDVWSWDPELEPLIRAGYRWWGPGGEALGEGRSAMPCSVAPGEGTILPLILEAPARSGSFTLEVDLVHEHVRWFERALRVPVSVVEDR